MSTRLHRIRVQNYRSLADVDLALRPINVMFGPNGAGKSTLLDALKFIQESVNYSSPELFARRGPDASLMFDLAPEVSKLSIAIETSEYVYSRLYSYASGRFDPIPGEQLTAVASPERRLVSRQPGSNSAELRFDEVAAVDLQLLHRLADPNVSGLSHWIQFRQATVDHPVTNLLFWLQRIRLYHGRGLEIDSLKRRGSETTPGFMAGPNGRSLFSVLRNLQGLGRIDSRFRTIESHLQRAFPGMVEIAFDQTGTMSVYVSFVKRNRAKPVLASAASDGHLQLLFLLTALFSESRDEPQILLFDEPETSLHPWAIAVFAEAVKLATSEWNRQVFIATHSPVLLSQFEPADCLAVETEEGRTKFRRLSEIEEVQDLLEHYAAGSLYMSEAIAPQSADPQPWFDEESAAATDSRPDAGAPK